MKKALHFLTLPLTQVVVIGLCAICLFCFENAPGSRLILAVMSSVAFVFYTAAGFLYSRESGKAIRISSVVFTVLLLWGVAFGSYALSESLGGDEVIVGAVPLYILVFCNPVVSDIVGRFVNLNEISVSVYSIILSSLAPLAVVPTVVCGKAFETKNKTLKIVLFAVLAAVFITLLVLDIFDVTAFLKA